MSPPVLRHDGVGSLITAAAARAPHLLAVADGRGVELTWAEYDRLTNRVAHGLLHRGLRPGDRLMVVLDERAEVLVLHGAAAKAGFVLVPANWRFKAAELQQIAEDCGPAAIVFGDAFAGAVHEALAQTDARPAPLLVQVGERSLAWSVEPWDRLADGPADGAVPLAGGPDLLYLGYTSGTTGRPKGVMLDHRAVRAAAPIAAAAYRLPAYGTSVMSGSLSFLSVAVAHFWSHVAMTSGTVLLGAYDLDRQLELIERYAATFTYLPTPVIPAAVDALAQAPEVLATLRSINVGASPIPAHVLSALADVAGDRVVGVYGLTEGTGVPLFAGQLHDWQRPEVGFERVGATVAPAVVRLVGAEGEDVPWDGVQVGEIVASSPAMMRGYWNDDAATALALRDGWLHTGDLGTLTPEGYLRIQGRAKDMLVSGGINVYPAEIEAVVQADAMIAECAVVGAPDARWGETPVAFVTLAGRVPAGGVEAYVAAVCRRRLANFKCPSAVVVLDTLPRNANGKILKTELRARAAGDNAARATQEDAP